MTNLGIDYCYLKIVNSLPKISSLVPDQFVIKQPCYFFVVWLQKEDSKINTDCHHFCLFSS